MSRTDAFCWRGYARIFLAVLLVCGSATLVFGRLPAAIACRPTATPGSFLSECRGIGDYEHAAYAWSLEPEAVAALKAAQVVLLGNSRMQFAFSSQVARDFFPERGIPAHRIGFGYGEGSAFPVQMMRRAGTQARLAIVNADPFFSEALSQPALRLRDAPGRVLFEALRAKVAVESRAAFCAAVPFRAACRGWRNAVHRVRADGAWSWQDSFTARHGATEVDAAPAPKLALPADATGLARAFLAETGLPPGCLVLTAVPNSESDGEAAAAALAEALGARLLVPRVAGLRTIDGSHLDAASAESWSRAFLDGLEPALRECL